MPTAPRADFTEVTNQSYGSKLKNACTGVCFGFLLFFGSIGLLIYNEGRTVKRAKDIDEGQELVVTLDLSLYNDTSSIPTTFDNQLIYAFGDLSTTDSLYDPTFGVGEAPALSNDGGSSSSTNSTITSTAENTDTTSSTSPLKLSRSVEMYQVIESSTSRKERTAGGTTRTVTDYSYNTGWSSTLIDSSAFREPRSDRVNPTSFPYNDLDWTADPILLGNIVLGDRVVSRLNWFQPVDSVSVSDVPDPSLASQLSSYQQNGLFYTSTNTSSYANPVVGDLRVTFEEVPPDTISIVALFRSDSSSLDQYTTSRGGALLLVKRGVFTSDELFQQADEENTTLAWILRAVGFVLMVISILLVLQPLSTAVEIIPFVGGFLQGGLERCVFPTIAILIALPIALFTIALAWLAYRPAWSVPILVVSAGIMVWLYFRARKAKADADDMKPDVDDDDEAADNDDKPPTSSYHYGAPDNNDGASSAHYQSGATAPSAATGGFASALDQPPPPAFSPAIPIVEPDVVLGEPDKPFVPQVYKP